MPPSPPSFIPELLHADVDLVLGTADDFCCLVWRGETTLQGVERVGEFMHRFGAGRDGMGLFTVVEERASLPSSEAREALASLMKSGAEKLRASVVVFEGAGFRAAAVRAVVTGLTLLARQPFPHRVFQDRQEAARWLVSAGPARWVGWAGALVTALDALRAQASRSG